MAILDKDKTKFNRDERGRLLPEVVELKTLPEDKYEKFGIAPDETPEVKVRPVTRGKLQRLQEKAERQQEETGDDIVGADVELIAGHVVEPDYDEDEVEDINDVDLVEALVAAIYAVSTGVSQEKIKEASADERMDEAREEFAGGGSGN